MCLRRSGFCSQFHFEGNRSVLFLCLQSKSEEILCMNLHALISVIFWYMWCVGIGCKLYSSLNTEETSAEIALACFPALRPAWGQQVPEQNIPWSGAWSSAHSIVDVIPQHWHCGSWVSVSFVLLSTAPCWGTSTLPRGWDCHWELAGMCSLDFSRCAFLQWLRSHVVVLCTIILSLVVCLFFNNYLISFNKLAFFFFLCSSNLYDNLSPVAFYQADLAILAAVEIRG